MIWPSHWEHEFDIRISTFLCPLQITFLDANVFVLRILTQLDAYCFDLLTQKKQQIPKTPNLSSGYRHENDVPSVQRREAI